ncbi:MAG: DUF2066 domain-containing protein [Hyphomicrobiales bacterium]|nr:DUF2066 domain-containing protein [Hyphomicrobiales bacterium]
MTFRIYLALSAILFAAGAQAQGGQGSLFTVAKVSVQAEAQDSVEAKQLAIAEGQKKALNTLMKRLTGFRAQNRLPQLDDAAIERMVDGLQVRQERASGTVYLAQLDYNFRAAAVKDVLNRFGVAFITERAPEVLVLPVYLAGGVIQPGEKNAWLQAWSRLDLANAISPVKLVQPRPDLTADAARAASTSPQSLEAINYQYRAEYLVLALAELDERGGLKVRLIGRDAAGAIRLERSFKSYGEEPEVNAQAAAQIALNVFEGRWKLRRLASQGALDGGSQELAQIDLSAQFAGLKEWRIIKDRLEKLPGVQSLDIKAVNPRGASITLEFPGGAERLAKTALSYGLTLEGGEGAWVLRLQ